MRALLHGAHRRSHLRAAHLMHYLVPARGDATPSTVRDATYVLANQGQIRRRPLQALLPRPDLGSDSPPLPTVAPTLKFDRFHAFAIGTLGWPHSPASPRDSHLQAGYTPGWEIG